ncbi:MAG TPA: metal-dependent transcriptional regulator [Actinomycetota bacterium]|nr:metal-dependent transcriptional regulator [Actinomycetota bacterium]
MLQHTSPAVQDYLKALHMLEWEGDLPAQGRTVSTQSLAQRLDVSAASATNMLKKLDGLGLVEHVPYKGASLTDDGRKIALEVVRHHRLLETYLAEVIGLPWDEVHAEAEILEHVLSEKLEDRISTLLGDPAADPHGHPIPAKDGSMPRFSSDRLWDIPDGRRTTVERVADEDPAALRYLAEAGIRPGAEIDVLRRGPVDGPLFVRVPGGGDPNGETALSRELAASVWVQGGRDG